MKGTCRPMELQIQYFSCRLLTYGSGRVRKDAELPHAMQLVLVNRAS